MQDITDGVSKFKGETEEINKWVDSLQRAYDPIKLRHVVDHINEPIKAQEFEKIGKRESTKSSPIGRHIGHYKTCIQNEDLFELLVNMISVGLMCGISLQRWHQSLNIMTEKVF